jgi:predicted transposase YdaD
MASSDHEIYELFKTEPRFLDVFIPMNPDATYTYESITFKKVQRSCDGMLKSSDPNEATVILEFQMQKNPDIYARIMSEIAIYHREHLEKKVRGVIIFKDTKTDPGDHNWSQVAKTCPGLLKVLYLNQIYEDLKRTQPNSPLQAVFAPFVEKDRNYIRQNAKKWSYQIDALPYLPEQRERMFDVYLSFLVDRLPGITKKEFLNMSPLARDLSHTQFYKDVAKETEVGANMRLLQEMLDEGLISQEVYDLKVKGLKEKRPA